MNDSDLLVVGTFLNKIEAEIARGALQAANIESMVAADDAGGTRPGLWMSGVRLLVRAVDAERATTILQQSNQNAPSPHKKTRKHRRR
jgi:Putative prokaryotic signal transducing protein